LVDPAYCSRPKNERRGLEITIHAFYYPIVVRIIAAWFPLGEVQHPSGITDKFRIVMVKE